MPDQPDTTTAAQGGSSPSPLFGVANMLAVLRMTRDMLDGAKKHWPEDRELKARSFYRWQDAIDSVSVVIADIEAMYPPNDEMRDGERKTTASTTSNL